jgi:hypothetical protein
MHNFFSFRRFVRLFAKHTREHLRTYLMSIGVLFGVLVLIGAFLFFVLEQPPDIGFQEASYVIMLFIAGTIFTSTIFQDFGDRAKAIPAMTLPASMFEKFLVGWLYSYPLFIVVYTGVFYLALWGLSLGRHWDPEKHFYLFSILENQFVLAFVLFSMLHAIAIFGAVLFRKLHFIKTGFAFFILLGVGLVLNTLFLKAITGFAIVKLALPFGFMNFYSNGQDYQMGISGRGPLVDVGTIFLAAIVLWVAAYFKLKEKQV